MRNYNIKAALFDLDGVIVFTDKYHYLAWKQLSDEQGWDFNETVNNRLRGIPRLASLEEILKHNNIDLPLEEKIVLMNRKNDYYVKLLEQINPGDVYPGSVEFIKKLRRRAPVDIFTHEFFAGAADFGDHAALGQQRGTAQVSPLVRNSGDCDIALNNRLFQKVKQPLLLKFSSG